MADSNQTETLTESPAYTPVSLDRNTENIKKLKEIMARDKGFTSLKDCVLAAIDFFIANHKESSS